MNGIELIAKERKRQQTDEGITLLHDDQHQAGELVKAAACYALVTQNIPISCGHDTLWPWDRAWFKPKGPLQDLVRAGALIAAELDRLLRQQRQAPEAHTSVPCPFCGAMKTYPDEVLVDDENQYFQVCSACGCEGPSSPCPALAIMLWDQRAV